MTTLDELRAWLDAAPEGTSLDAKALGTLLADLNPEARRDRAEPDPSFTPESETWRTKLWTCPAETRLGVAEAAEALGHPKSYVYAHTGPKAENPLPHRKLDGALTFTAGELRHWLRSREQVIEAGQMEGTEKDRRLQVTGGRQ